MSEASSPAPNAGRAVLWTGVWGGAIAWFVHLFAAYGLAEFGCVATWSSWQWLGLTAVAWLILLATVVTLAAALGSGWLAWRSYRAFREGGSDEQEARRGLARIGLILNALFVFSILFESVPIFFFSRC